MNNVSPEDILEYWYGPAPAPDRAALGAKLERWFGNQAVAGEIGARFGELTETAVRGGLREWEATPRGCLALIIVLDQFTRYIHGADPRAYLGDARAVALAIRLLDDGLFEALGSEEQQFAIMPLAHAEDIELQRRGLAAAHVMVAAAPTELRPVFEIAINQLRKFIGVMERFGRFPHRNAILGRVSSSEERAFLETWPALHPPADVAERLRG